VTERNLIPDIDLWRPSSLQLVLFTMTPHVNVAQEWWQQVTGSEPNETTKKRQELTITGDYGDANLVLSIDHLRIIWTLSARIDPLSPPLTLPTIAAYSSARDVFANLISPWIAELCPQIKRMAVTGLLMRECNSHEAGYYMLQRYLEHAVKIDPDSTDFMYRVNRPRQSKSTTFDLRINRLTTWSFVKYAVSEQAYLLGGDPAGSPIVASTTGYGALLQCDVNTDAERSEKIPRESVEPLLCELFDMTNEIAVRGDVP
jgi:hypothetical protein